MVSPVAKKLGIKQQTRALVIAPPIGYLDLLAPLPEGAVVSHQLSEQHEFIQLSALLKSKIQKSAPDLLKHAAPGAIVWITYPKKTSGVASDLSREEVWDAMSPFGWRPVSAVSIDDVWSALRFRPVEDVKSKRSPVK